VKSLRNAIVTYLQAAGPRTTREIADVVAEPCAVDIKSVNTALMRMANAGQVERLERGRYAAGAETVYVQMLVAGLLDRLLSEYGEATEAELRRRGWRKLQ
jgi:predicted transcriptional regulator